MTGLILAVVVLLGVMSAGTYSVSAESALVTSEDCINVLKEEEGFSAKPYWDYSQYTVGFCTKCPDDMLTYYRENGITEEEAEVLLKNHLASIELDINKRIVDGCGLSLEQNQFDALVLFSYNCGTGWVYDDNGTLNKALKNGAEDTEIIRALALWCNAGGQIKDFLLRRRLSEANMFLNGEYSRTPPEHYSYVLYEANGGTVSPRSQGYDSDKPVKPFSVPTYTGYTFDGWYTERTGGTKVEELDASVKHAILYAHWLDAEGNPPVIEQIAVKVIVNTNDVNLRKGPGTNYTIVGTANIGDQLTITETASSGALNWGKFDGGWICLQYTDFDTASQESTTPPETTEPETTEPETTEPETTEPETTQPETTQPDDTKPAGQMGTVRVDGELNVRSGPSTGYEKIGTLPNDTRVEILEKKTNGSMIWGKTTHGWISLDYVVLDSASGGTAQWTGKVVNCTELRIRSGAGTNYTHIGNLSAGTQVEIFEKKANGSMEWGRISSGWISLDYVQLDSGTNDPVDNSTQTDNTGADVKWVGTVVNCSQLRIRSGAGISYSHVGNLPAGTRVEIYEKKANGATNWAKIDQGWISMDYVQLESEDGSGETVSLSGVVTAEEFLRIRTGPGTSYSVAGYLNPGDKVQITQKRQNGSMTWGKIDKGWISLDYIRVDDGSGSDESTQKPDADNIKTVTADCLRVRDEAGTSNPIVGYLYYGSKVEITETKDVAGVTWGKTSQGWISMDYVK